MGPDLHVTSAVLAELIAAFSGFSRQMAHACHDVRVGDSEVTGSDPLAGRVHGFAGSWHYGLLSQLDQHGSECARMLREVGSTFDRLDHELASELARG